MRKEKTPDKSLPKKPSGPQPGESRPPGLETLLRELDTVDAEFGDEFYDGLHDRIMARIEKTPAQTPPAYRRKASSSGLSLVQLSL